MQACDRKQQWPGVYGAQDDWRRWHDILARTEHVRGYFARRNFLRSNPDFILPPTELAYDAYGPWDPKTYRTQGIDHAAYIAGLIKQYRPGAKVICEWGCGPMCVLRHMRKHFPSERLVGLDYNRRTIDWCSGNFADIEFLANSLQPPIGPLRERRMRSTRYRCSRICPNGFIVTMQTTCYAASRLVAFSSPRCTATAMWKSCHGANMPDTIRAKW